MKLHPLSVPYRAVSRGLSVASTFVFLGLTLSGTGAVPELTGPFLVGAALAGVAATVAWQVAYYRRFEYELTDEGLDIASGVVSRRHREIPLRRVQNVDISRNVVQRALGLAALDLETAGGGETEASLRYVGYDEAKRLQREIQRLKRDATRSDREVGDDAEGEGESAVGEGRLADREELLFELSATELAILSALSFDLRYLSLLAFGPVALPAVPGLADLAVVGGVMLVGMLAVALWAIGAAVAFARYYGFRLTRIGDELRYERGLLQRYDGSIPLEKVQALTVSENLPMRRFGYAALSVETAGYAPGQSPSGGSEAAIPLATRERVFDLAREVEPFDPPEFSRPPERARTRYVARYAIALAALAGVLFGARAVVGWPDQWYLALALVPLTPVAAHLTWVNRGYDAGDRYVVTRNGFWRRSTTIVAYDRVQTVIQSQSPFQRRRDLASVVVDTASSAGFGGRDATAVDLDADDAAALRELVGQRLQDRLAARRADRRARGRRAKGAKEDDQDEDGEPTERE
ncbi:PH domain-containing protein [Halorussus salilacus]|uniref:PH domain-containing protein n=1 Tax=Halorussus salilacus TaxID=2953750 RepID=UPI0020A12911|nr:PH domain-containing protein [Halorussus salilacus]USZ68577.1 PH domain-containing protein [Halorussus salilacus]